jgi:hypothetical protein
VTEQSARGFFIWSVVVGCWSVVFGFWFLVFGFWQSFMEGNYGNRKYGNHRVGVEVLRTLWRAVAADPGER